MSLAMVVLPCLRAPHVPNLRGKGAKVQRETRDRYQRKEKKPRERTESIFVQRAKNEESQKEREARKTHRSLKKKLKLP